MSKTVATFVQKVGLIWIKGGFYFSCSGHRCNRWLNTVNHWDKRDNRVLCTGKEIKSGLKLVLELAVATPTCTVLLRKKPERSDVNTVLNFCEIKVCPKTRAYFTLKLGWLKTNAGTNIGPRNNMCLSAPGTCARIEISQGADNPDQKSKMVSESS